MGRYVLQIPLNKNEDDSLLEMTFYFRLKLTDFEREDQSKPRQNDKEGMQGKI